MSSSSDKAGAFDIVAYIFIALICFFLGTLVLWLTVEMWRMILSP